MALPITRTSRGLVLPNRETPSGNLDLSFIDKLPVLRCNARTLHVFRHGPGASGVIREALSKALVPYYPLAGHLKESGDENGEVRIECSGQGVWFVEAIADCALNDFNYFDDVSGIPFEDLLPDFVPQVDGLDPLVKMQVTQFACGGFVMGLIFCHTICDGLGAAQFLNAVGELARGLQNPSIAPTWSREFQSPKHPQKSLATTNSLPFIPTEPITPNYRLVHANIDISMGQINGLKQEFRNLTGQNCSSFEAVVATLWRNRTKAINFEHNTEVKLVFFANSRKLLDPPLPEGFYGNCFFPVTITTTSDSLTQLSNVSVVKLVQQAKTSLPEEFAKYVRGESMMNNGHEDPFAPPLNYTTLFISEWGRLGFNQVDYGWGPPVHVVPIQGSAIIPVGIVGSLPLPHKGIRLMTWCIEDVHRQLFLDQVNNPASTL